MSPLTRLRGTANFLPHPDLASEYYSQRASAGLIITEGIPVDRMGVGYAHVPGIWSSDQVECWKTITDTVHRAGGHIFAQLWHVGRISHSSRLDGRQPIGPSANQPVGLVRLMRPETRYETPRALSRDEIAEVVEQFRSGAQNAKLAGFDGVELHGGNGYLLDQFLQSESNTRDDEYGGSVHNRARFMLECTDAAISIFGLGRVGMHLAPRSDAHSIADANPQETFTYAAHELGSRKIAFLLVREYEGPDSLGKKLKEVFGGLYVVNEGFSFESATQALAEGRADAASFGKLFLANPDLPRRFREGRPLNQPRAELFYTNEAEGYTDYPPIGS